MGNGTAINKLALNEVTKKDAPSQSIPDSVKNSPDQAELYNVELIKQLEQYEKQKKMVLLTLEGKKDKEDIKIIKD